MIGKESASELESNFQTFASQAENKRTVVITKDMRASRDAGMAQWGSGF